MLYFFVCFVMLSCPMIGWKYDQNVDLLVIVLSCMHTCTHKEPLRVQACMAIVLMGQGFIQMTHHSLKSSLHLVLRMSKLADSHEQGMNDRGLTILPLTYYNIFSHQLCSPYK